MIVDARQLEDKATLTGSIAIIGGGAAGITLAMELASQFQDVLLLESGGLAYEQETQDLYDGPLLGHKSTALDRSRLRFLGGSTNHWNGLCTTLDEVDFKRVAGRPFGGWPFDSDELTPFYRRAFPYCQIGPYHDNSSIIAAANAAACRIVESDEFDLGVVRLSPPTRFGERYRAALRSDRIRAYLHANVTSITIAPGGTSVSSLEVRTLTGRQFTVAAAAYVLCCGGIENARILLNCNRFFQAGIGNEYDLVGRFFMDHLVTEAGRILPRGDSFDCELMKTTFDGPIPLRVILKNSRDVIRRRGRLGCSLYFDPEYGQSDPILSAAKRSPAYLALREMAHDVRRGSIPERLSDRLCDVLDDLGAVAIALSRSPAPFKARGARNVARNRSVASILVRIEAEQTPNPHSRVVLTSQSDALGMQKAALDWRINRDDLDSMYQAVMAVAHGVGASGFGRMLVNMEQPVDDAKISTAWHHMGTTRMDDDRRQGVVDRNCRVHGLANFFVAGSSVFPTGSRANPTLTIVALAIRLADQLKRTVKPT